MEQKKHTIVVEARLDIDDVIKAMSFIKKETGYLPPSRGAFLKICVQAVASMSEEEEPDRTMEEKLHLLQMTFGGPVNLGKFKLGRIQVNPSISHAIAQENTVVNDGDDIARKIQQFMQEGKENK
jgi:hypothetical protein